MNKLVLAILLAAGGVAHAQESPENARETAEATELQPTPEDPSAHFNFLNFFDYRGKDEYGGPMGDGQMVKPDGEVVHEEEPMSPPFVLMLVNFGVLLWLLGKYLLPAANKLSEDRHDQIKNALDEAQKLRDQAAAKLAEYETRIKDVDKEIAKLVDDIRAAADADKARILAAAETQAALMKRDAELRIAAEIEIARAQLKAEVTAAAATATEQMLRDKTTPDDQKKLVSTFIAGIQ